MTLAARPALDRAFVAPRDDVESRLATIWEAVLRVGPLGVDDAFFDLGGESLHAFALAARVKRDFGVLLTARDFFEADTIAGMAALVRERSTPG